MKFLVTGGAGYIGSHMVNLLLKQNSEVVVLDNLSTGHEYNIKDCEHLNIDIVDAENLSKKLYKRKFDGVFHFAGKSIVSESINNPDLYYLNNITGTKNLLKAMLDNDLNNLIFSSSAAVYGKSELDYIVEDTNKVPINPYGKSKLQAEKDISETSGRYGLNSISLRYFNACGADPGGKFGEDHACETHLIPNILQSLLDPNEAFYVYGNSYPTKDGTCIRDYVHVNDIAKAHYLAFENFGVSRMQQAYNIGIGKGFSVLEIIKTCEQVTNSKIDIKFKDKREGDPKSLVASNKSILMDLNWNPQFTMMQDIIDTAWKWHTKRFELYGH
ncbi:UDP-glucose 4-epimerase GalE [Pelagibacteraceae bacterium]|jgi:UDP-glucose 4-epimerase|nr:UDP-glucose 4-epimerase GalE [Pelagibacteraceae bacterium]